MIVASVSLCAQCACDFPVWLGITQSQNRRIAELQPTAEPGWGGWPASGATDGPWGSRGFWGLVRLCRRLRGNERFRLGGVPPAGPVRIPPRRPPGAFGADLPADVRRALREADCFSRLWPLTSAEGRAGCSGGWGGAGCAACTGAYTADGAQISSAASSASPGMWSWRWGRV